jgi:CheY-like chemotaxis protein
MANEKKTVLLAQQKNDWRDLLVHVIERCGYDVIATSNPEAVTESMSAGFDLILLDLELLKERAEIVIAAFQKDPSTRHIPIICQTRYGNDRAAQQVIQAGAKEILYKPFDLTDLPSILRRYLSNGSYSEKCLPDVSRPSDS